MKSKNIIALCSVVVGLTGCGGSDADSVAVPAPAAAPAVEMAAPAPVAAPAPAPTAPPPAAPEAGAPAMAGTAVEEKGDFETLDADGKPIPALEFVNAAIDGYERMRASMTEGETWPPITNINQLTAYRIIRRLPSAPAGKQYVIDPETKRAALAPK